jgi:hypothetical protein
MKTVRYAVLCALLFVSLTACNSRKEQKAAVPQANQQAPVQELPVAPTDKADADAAAARVIEQFRAGDFSGIYRQASEGFRAVGTEGQFVGAARNARTRTGPVREVRLLKYYGRVDKFTVYLYEVRYDKVSSELRLSFGRSKSGTMELCGLNQRDLTKKN